MTSEVDTERLALQLFRSLLDLDTASRASLDAELAQTDPAVAARVRAMLQRHRSTTDRLERPWRDAPTGMSPPARLGAFVLAREIGRGGMGVVALGERQAEGFTQRVAIKWIPGSQFDPARRARFLFERDVVARLQHPHIAQLVDGGEGEAGELWYAMELVDGSDLPTHCRERRLDLRARVGLLLDLCDAVAHAHRHSILHRDIKPGNVLVTPDGQLKLIDFGIAKALDGEAADLTQEAAPMTPRYAAPEQLRGERPTTASDEWQLAALAYEVLCGTPVREEGERVLVLPSQRALQSGDGNGFGTDAGGLARALRGDLDAIVSKALDDAPERRYAGVAELARELRDWLAGRPIASRRHERWYAARRFASTHRWALGFAGLAFVALLGAAVVSIVFGNRAREEARIANRTSELVSDMFLSNEDGRNLPSMTMSDFFAHLVDTAATDTELPVANRYHLLRDLAPRAAEVGAAAAAERAAHGVLELAPSLFGTESQQVAQANDTLAMIALHGRGRAAAQEVQPYLDEAARIYGVLGMENHVDFLGHLRARLRMQFILGDTAAMLETSRRHVAAAQKTTGLSTTLRLQSRVMLASSYDAHGDVAQAAVEADRVVEEAEIAAQQEPGIAQQIDWLKAVACEYHSRANPDIALSRCGDFVKYLEAGNKIDSKNGYEALLGLCTAQGKLGQNEAALATCRRAERALGAVEGADSTSVNMASMQRRIGTRSFALGRFDDAVLAQRRALDIAIDFMGATHADVLGVRMELAESLLASGRPDEASDALPAGLDLARLSDEKRQRWDGLRARASREMP